jgi:hypothetical protein
MSEPINESLENEGRNRRQIKNFLINPRYQIKYIFWITFSGLSLIAIHSWIVFRYIKENYDLLVELSPMTDEAKALLYTELYQLFYLLGGISFLFLGIVTLLGIYFSFRTAGPLYRLKKGFDEILSKKDIPKGHIYLRPTDEFQEVAESFNAMLDRVSLEPTIDPKKDSR